MRKLISFIFCMAIALCTIHAGVSDSHVAKTKYKIESMSPDMDFSFEKSEFTAMKTVHSEDLENIPIGTEVGNKTFADCANFTHSSYSPESQHEGKTRVTTRYTYIGNPSEEKIPASDHAPPLLSYPMKL